MIGRIAGTLLEKNPPHLLVDCHGVGYEIDVPMSTFYNLPAVGQPVTLLTQQIIREDAHLLFGFGTATERNTFALIAPVLGLAGAMAWRSRKRGALTLVGALTLLMLLSHTLQHAFPQTVLAMAKPLACVVLFVWLARLALQASAERATIPTI